MEASAATHAGRRLFGGRSPLLRLHREDRLVAMIRSGHEGAFEVLFSRYQPRLLAFCRHMVGSQEDAEDVLQEVFVSAYKAMLADEREINVRPWLYRIARNRCLNHLRRPTADGQDEMDVHPHEHGTTTHDRVQDREEFRNLVADVGELPETQRTALLLREIDGMPYEEIGRAMETTVPAVKSLLVRARINLAESSKARLLTCDEVRVELAEAAEGLSRASGPARRHIRGCEPCKDFRRQLRSDDRALAAIFPIGPIVLLQHLLGVKLSGAAATGATGASAGAGAAGSGATAGGIGAALGSKAVASVASVALLTAGAVEVKRVTGHDSKPKAESSTAKPEAKTEPKEPAVQPTATTTTPAPARQDTTPSRESGGTTAGSGGSGGASGSSGGDDGSGEPPPPPPPDPIPLP